MTSWTFAAGAESWTTPGGSFQWNATEGIVPGCLWVNNAGGDEVTELTISPVTPVMDDPFSLWARVTANTPESTPNDNMTIQFAFGANGASHLFEADGILGYDSGWVRIAGVVTNDSEVTLLQIAAQALTGGLDVYIDNVFFLESDGLSYGFPRSAGGVPGSIAI